MFVRIPASLSPQYLHCCALIFAICILLPAPCPALLRPPNELVTMLRKANFQAVNKRLDGLLTRAQADIVREDELRLAIDEFSRDDPSLLPLLNAWASATPKVAYPYFARGVFWDRLGFSDRGTASAARTSDKQFDEMRKALSRASDDLRKSLDIDARIHLAYCYLMQGEMAGGERTRFEKWYSDGLRSAPQSAQIRWFHINGLEPRWFGSEDDVVQAVQEAKRTLKDPARINLIAGRVFTTQGDKRFRRRDYKSALDLFLKGKGLGGSHWFYERKIGEALYRLNRHSEAVAAFRSVIASRPHYARGYLWLGYSYYRLGNIAEARDAFQAVINLEPAHPEAHKALKTPGMKLIPSDS